MAARVMQQASRPVLARFSWWAVALRSAAPHGLVHVRPLCSSKILPTFDSAKVAKPRLPLLGVVRLALGGSSKLRAVAGVGACMRNRATFFVCVDC